MKKHNAVVILCSGPSMTAEDARAVKHLRCYATNSTIFLAPWTYAVVGYDLAWWRDNIKRVEQEAQQSIRYSMLRTPKEWGVICLQDMQNLGQCGNSGALALGLAAIQNPGATLILLGADCSIKNGLHWHGAHPNLKNCLSVDRWPKQFGAAGAIAKKHGCHVINASRETELKLFNRMTIYEAITLTSQ